MNVRVQDPENGRDVPERCEATERVEPAANVAGEVGALSAHAVRPDASRTMVASDVRMCASRGECRRFGRVLYCRDWGRGPC